MSYAMIYWAWTPDSFAQQSGDWRQAIREYTTVYRRSMSAYVRWRLATELPGIAVREVTINVRVFLLPKQDESPTRPAPITVPLAKWLSEEPDRLMPYDPVTRVFVRDCD
jgi:hypothetical protein